MSKKTASLVNILLDAIAEDSETRKLNAGVALAIHVVDQLELCADGLQRIADAMERSATVAENQFTAWKAINHYNN